MASKLTKLPSNLTRGDTPIIQFPFTINGSAANLTGWTLTLTITHSSAPVSGDSPVIQITQAGDSTGVVSFQLLADQTLNATNNLLPDETYYYDVQFWNGSTGTARRVFTPIKGQFTVDTDYTVV